jgi:hypothetical protein
MKSKDFLENECLSTLPVLSIQSMPIKRRPAKTIAGADRQGSSFARRNKGITQSRKDAKDRRKSRQKNCEQKDVPIQVCRIFLPLIFLSDF